MLDLRIVKNGRPLQPFELAMELGRPTAMRMIGDHIEALIDTLDQLSGDCDLEDDDPSNDPCDWGEPEEYKREGIEIAHPRYGEDQSLFPVNKAMAQREWHRAAYNT